jgi:gas vesicle structural protein
MAVERVSGGSSLIDVLDRVLDKGIVIDAWVRISLVGIDLITVEARVVVASIDTYLKYADAVGLTGLVSRPQLETEEEVETVETIEPVRRPVRTKVRRVAARR